MNVITLVYERKTYKDSNLRIPDWRSIPLTNRTFPCCILPQSVSQQVFMRNHSYEIVLPLLVHFHANQTRVQMKGFTRRLVLSHKATR